MPTPHVLAELARATDRNGVIRSSRLHLSRDQRRSLVQARLIEKRHNGVYALVSHPQSPQHELAIAVASGGSMSGGWARSSAAMCKLLDEHPATPEIVIKNTTRARYPRANVHRSLDLQPSHLFVKDGIRCVKPLITAVDLGVVLGPMAVAEVLVRANQMKLFTPAGFETTIGRLAKPGRTGITVAREALNLLMIDERAAESVLELRFHHGPGKGLPPYEYQWQVHLNGQTYFIDFAYPGVMLAIEVDGWQSRQSYESLDYNNNRQNALMMAGWVVLRFSWRKVLFDPAGVQRDILRELAGLGYGFAA